MIISLQNQNKSDQDFLYKYSDQSKQKFNEIGDLPYGIFSFLLTLCIESPYKMKIKSKNQNNENPT